MTLSAITSAFAHVDRSIQNNIMSFKMVKFYSNVNKHVQCAEEYHPCYSVHV